MELFCNTSNGMTRWLVKRGALTSPFVLIDVGVQDGISARWHALGDHLTVYGFDLLKEAIAPLTNVHDPRKHYFAIGLADRDGELEIGVPANRYETQLFGDGAGERRLIQVRRLDTLLSEGLVQPADFVKLDCEGYEPLVLQGAANFLSRSNLVGADTESNFNLSSDVPDTHFSECCNPFVRQRLMVFDIAFNRLSMVNSPALTGRSILRPATLNLLFGRNLVQERDSGPSYIYRSAESPVSPQTVLKSAIVFEAYGLLDWACYVLKGFADQIGSAIDIDAAIAQLAPPAEPASPTPQNQGLITQLRTMKRSLMRKIR